MAMSHLKGSDVEVLLQNLTQADPKTRCQALATLGSILNSSAESRDHFKELGGSTQILNVMSIEKDRTVVETSLYALGCSVNQHVGNQTSLCSQTVFAMLHEILKNPLIVYYSRLTHSAAFLLLAVVSRNHTGQTLARESGCLDDLIILFQYLIGFLLKSKLSQGANSADMLVSVCRALSFCVNNPQNHQNQHQVALVLPKAVEFLKQWLDTRLQMLDLMQSLLSLLCQVISGSVTNQKSFADCSGIDIIIRCISVFQQIPNRNEDVEDLMINLLDVCVADSKPCKEIAGSLNTVPLLLNILQKCSSKSKLPVLLTLVHLVESSKTNIEQFMKSNGVAITVVCTVDVSTDEEVSKATKCLITECVQGYKSEQIIGTPISGSVSSKQHTDIDFTPWSKNERDDLHLQHPKYQKRELKRNFYKRELRCSRVNVLEDCETATKNSKFPLPPICQRKLIYDSSNDSENNELETHFQQANEMENCAVQGHKIVSSQAPGFQDVVATDKNEARMEYDCQSTHLNDRLSRCSCNKKKSDEAKGTQSKCYTPSCSGQHVRRTGNSTLVSGEVQGILCLNSPSMKLHGCHFSSVASPHQHTAHVSKCQSMNVAHTSVKARDVDRENTMMCCGSNICRNIHSQTHNATQTTEDKASCSQCNGRHNLDLILNQSAPCSPHCKTIRSRSGSDTLRFNQSYYDETCSVKSISRKVEKLNVQEQEKITAECQTTPSLSVENFATDIGENVPQFKPTRIPRTTSSQNLPSLQTAKSPSTTEKESKVQENAVSANLVDQNHSYLGVASKFCEVLRTPITKSFRHVCSSVSLYKKRFSRAISLPPPTLENPERGNNSLQETDITQKFRKRLFSAENKAKSEAGDLETLTKKCDEKWENCQTKQCSNCHSSPCSKVKRRDLEDSQSVNRKETSHLSSRERIHNQSRYRDKLQWSSSSCDDISEQTSSSESEDYVPKLKRRKRSYGRGHQLKYTRKEIENLISGIEKYGLDFQAIRRAYQFHPKRTPKDLYLKWYHSLVQRGNSGK